MILGIDVGGTGIKFGAFAKEKREPLFVFRVSSIGVSLPLLSEYLYQSITEEFTKRKLPVSDITAVGIGVPGPVNESGEVASLVNMSFREKNPGEALSRKLGGIPVLTANDANLAALGEACYGENGRVKNAVLLTIGTGVGGGIILDGKIRAGFNGAAGEIGHFVVEPRETEPCNCGNRGCLEQYASATGIRKLFEKRLHRGEKSAIGSGAECEEIFNGAKSGDPVCLAVLDEAASYLGLAVSHLILTVDAEVIYTGGGASAAGEILRSRIERYALMYSHIAPEIGEIKIATLSGDAGIYGARALAEEA